LVTNQAECGYVVLNRVMVILFEFPVYFCRVNTSSGSEASWWNYRAIFDGFGQEI
jgi:hypothetical protein